MLWFILVYNVCSEAVMTLVGGSRTCCFPVFSKCSKLQMMKYLFLFLVKWKIKAQIWGRNGKNSDNTLANTGLLWQFSNLLRTTIFLINGCILNRYCLVSHFYKVGGLTRDRLNKEWSKLKLQGPRYSDLYSLVWVKLQTLENSYQSQRGRSTTVFTDWVKLLIMSELNLKSAHIQCLRKKMWVKIYIYVYT